jgi:hypothetical protein
MQKCGNKPQAVDGTFAHLGEKFGVSSFLFKNEVVAKV